jgi:hypothetical protein
MVCIGPTLALAKRRVGASRAASKATFAQAHASLPASAYLAPDIEAAERQLGLLLRRMRAYQRAPYDFARSRIPDDAEFERCLDLATALGLRIRELSGASMADARERERIRDQILESLSRNANVLGRVIAGRSAKIGSVTRAGADSRPSLAGNGNSRDGGASPDAVPEFP